MNFKKVILLMAFSALLIHGVAKCAIEQERAEEAREEEKFWASGSFSFRPTSCRDEKNGEDCAILFTPRAWVLLFPQMGRVYLEGQIGSGGRTAKLVLEHGTKGQRIANVPAGYKLLSCYCNQEECLIRTPHTPVYVQYFLDQTFSFTKNKPE